MAAKISGRIKRAIGSSLALFVVAGVLAASNAYIQGRDRNLAIGPESNDQKEFFTSSVDRPDIATFFKKFKPTERQAIARNLRRYQDPRIVHLAVVWLVDFDPLARKELQDVLISLAAVYPKELAVELTNNGGFQKLAVFAALRSAGQKTLPHVIDQLSVAPARANAVEYLVAFGPQVGKALVVKLSDADKDTQHAAADALGKLGFKEAGPSLRQLYKDGDIASKSAMLAALANLGDPGSFPIFQSVVSQRDTAPPDRASAILGLGRIADRRSIDLLWELAIGNPPDKGSILESLSVAGAASLEKKGYVLADRLEVAAGIQGTAAEAVISEALQTSDPISNRAAEVSAGREALVGFLADRLRSIAPKNSGGRIEILVKALSSTRIGQQILDEPDIQSKYGGFIARERSLAR